MAEPEPDVDISDLDDVRRIVEHARTLHRPVILRSDDVEVAKVVPLRTRSKATDRRTSEDYEEFVLTLGAWQPDIDVDQLKADFKVAHGSKRTPVQL